MELEELSTRLTLDAQQFFAALDAAERELRETGAVSDATTARLAAGWPRAGAGVSAASGRIVASNRLLRGSMQNVAFEVADVAQQLEAGVPALRVFAVL